MRTQHNPRKSSQSQRNDSRRSLPNMATPRKPEPPPKMGFLGFILILGILGASIWLVMLIGGLGPYRVDVPTPTPTMIELQTIDNTLMSSLTVTQTTTPNNNSIATPTLTQIPTHTPTITPTATLTPEPTLELMPFQLKGEPEALSSDLIRPELGCGWLIIAGQVWDLQDAAVTNLTLRLYGELGGYDIDLETLTGFAPAYGESGFEFTLENLVVESDGTLFIQLVDSNGLPLSHPYPVQTYEDCSKNLILVNFHQVR